MSKLKIKNLDTNEFEELPLIQGEKGERGYSAYEIAVQNGYKGTEAEWTNAFLSPDGYYGKTEIDNKENNLKAENEYLNSVIEQAFTPVEKEGTSINYDNTINARFKDIKLCGDTTQNGEPTPDTPIPVNVVTGDNEINEVGKNYYNINVNYDWVGVNTNYTITGNIINVKGKYFVAGLQSVKSNTNYTISATRQIIQDNNTCGTIRVFTPDKSQMLGEGKTTFTFNTGNNNQVYVLLYAGLNEEGNVNFSNIQLEKGSSVTDFEPYQGNTYNIDLPEGMELCKIGDYQDYIHKDNGKWYLEKQIGKVVLDGSESGWGNDGGNAPYAIYKGDMFRKNDLSVVLSNKFMGVSYSSNWNLYNYLITTNTTANQRPAIRIKYDTNALTLDEFKTWLSTHNTIVYYVLATPTTTEITDTTLLEQLEELAGAKTYAGETNIVATSDGLTIIPKTTALTK